MERQKNMIYLRKEWEQYKTLVTPRKKIVLADMDNATVNYDGGFEKKWNTRHPDLPFTPQAERKEFYAQDEHPEYEQLIYEILSEPKFFYELEPIEGAIAGMKALAQYYDVRICTSPALHNIGCMPGKYDWVERHLGEEWIHKIIVTKSKTLIHGDYLIDDRPEIRGDQPAIWQHILYDQPYNQHINKPRITWNKLLEHNGDLEATINSIL